LQTKTEKWFKFLISDVNVLKPLFIWPFPFQTQYRMAIEANHNYSQTSSCWSSHQNSNISMKLIYWPLKYILWIVIQNFDFDPYPIARINFVWTETVFYCVSPKHVIVIYLELFEVPYSKKCFNFLYWKDTDLSLPQICF
jgi:hypothetical protein